MYMGCEHSISYSEALSYYLNKEIFELEKT